MCTVWWISHQTFIHDLQSVNRRLLWINSLFLMLTAFLPFPTGLLGHHPGQPIATAFYGIVCAMTGLSFCGMRWYASAHSELMKPEIPSAALNQRAGVSAFSPILYLTGALISLFSPTVAFGLYAANSRVFRRWESGSFSIERTLIE